MESFGKWKFSWRKWTRSFFKICFKRIWNFMAKSLFKRIFRQFYNWIPRLSFACKRAAEKSKIERFKYGLPQVIQPNKMQQEAIVKLDKLRKTGVKKHWLLQQLEAVKLICLFLMLFRLNRKDLCSSFTAKIFFIKLKNLLMPCVQIKIILRDFLLGMKSRLTANIFLQHATV